MQNEHISAARHRLLSPRNLLIVGLLLLNLVIFSATDPVSSPPAVVILGFLVAAADVYLLARFTVRFVALFVPRLQVHRHRLTVLLTAFFVICLGLGSVGQLTWRDLLVVVIVAAVGYFYSFYFRIRARQ